MFYVVFLLSILFVFVQFYPAFVQLSNFLSIKRFLYLYGILFLFRLPDDGVRHSETLHIIKMLFAQVLVFIFLIRLRFPADKSIADIYIYIYIYIYSIYI